MRAADGRRGQEKDGAGRPFASGGVSKRAPVVAGTLAVLVAVWAAVALAVEGPGFAIPASERLHGVEEATLAFSRLFAALVLALFLSGGEGWRMRWVAAGLAVQGVGHLIFGYVEPLVQGDPPGLNEGLYEALVARTLACALFAVGLVPQRPPRRPVWIAAVLVAAAPVAGYVVVFEFLGGEGWMPPLARAGSAEQALGYDSPAGWLTPLHWALSAPALALALAAAGAAFRRHRRGHLPGWLLVALALLAGSALHEYLWPSNYAADVFTSADVLRLAFAAVVLGGGIFELRRAAGQRAALLRAERERTRRLGELSDLRADFSAMVAHELDGPLAAIRRLSEMLSAGGDRREVREYAASAIREEVEALDLLVSDVRASAAAERDDFAIRARPVPLRKLLRNAEALIAALPDSHPARVVPGPGLNTNEQVLADPERVGQVLRNLLSNAATYTPPGTQIELRASRIRSGRRVGDPGGCVRLRVADAGPGVRPEDARRIFEKYGRGGAEVPGTGLGLYLSRRIARAHGSDLTLEPNPGGGAVFSFELRVAG